MAAGMVVLLNGASSSGKSTIARQLLEDFDTPWFHMGVDMFGAMRADAQTRDLDEAELAAALRRTRAGFHRAVAGMAQAGNDVVMDHVLSEPWRLDDVVTVLADIDVVFVGVHCSLAELQRREAIRGDRTVGTAASQYRQVYSHGDYDVEVDTGVESAAACATRIIEYLRAPPTERAFERIRRRLTLLQQEAPD